MKGAHGGCALQHISIQSLRSSPVQFMASSCIGEPPTDAPFKLILFQLSNMQTTVITQTPLHQYTHQSRNQRQDVLTFPPYPIDSGKSHSPLPFHFFISQYRMVQKHILLSLKDNKHLFSCQFGVSKNCRGPLVLLNDEGMNCQSSWCIEVFLLLKITCHITSSTRSHGVLGSFRTCCS